MKSIYFRARIFLMMCAFGLAAVGFSNALPDQWSAISVDVPKIESDAPIYIQPLTADQVSDCFDSSCNDYRSWELKKRYASGVTDSTIYTVDFCKAFKEPARYDGKIIRVKTYYRTGIDTVALTSSTCKEWMRPIYPNHYGNELNKLRRKIEQIWRYGSSAEVDLTGRYTHNIADPTPNQRGYPVHLFEIIEINSAKFTKRRKSF